MRAEGDAECHGEAFRACDNDTKQGWVSMRLRDSLILEESR